MCKAEGCNNNKLEARGYCNKHYQQVLKYGHTVATCRDFNIIVDRGSYYILILTNKKLEINGKAKIDKEDLSKLQKYGRWSLDKNGYVVNKSKNTSTLMHRVVMNATINEHVDHKKVGFKYKRDNRKTNLRKCTCQQNNFNMSKRKDNTSGFKGVGWSKSKQKWRAYISINGVFKHLGYFNDINKASKVYKIEAKKLHKDFYNHS